MGLTGVRAAFGLLVCATALSAEPGPSSANEGIERLAGRWAGEGTMVQASGPDEQFRCVITYAVGEESSRVRQHLRCQGHSTKFDAVTTLAIEDNRVTGVWADNVYWLNGTVRGKVTDKGFDIRLLSSYFQAKMTVSTSGCEQLVRVVPEGSGSMKEMAATLKKSDATKKCQTASAAAALRPIVPPVPVPAVRPTGVARR
jgi:hypothetical protein